MSEWVEKTLGELADLVMGQSPESSSVSELPEGLPFLQGCAEFGQRNPEPKFHVNPPLRIAPKGSTLISVRAPVGTMNDADQRYGIGRGLAAVIGKERSNQFLRYAIQLNSSWLHRRSQGSTFLAVGSDDLRKLPVKVANDPEICEAAATVVTLLDTQIEATEALLAKQERVRAGLMQDLFTRGVDEHGQLRPARDQAPHLYHQTELGWLPLGWEVEKLDDLVRVIDCKHFTPNYVDEGYPILRPRNVKSDGLDFVNVDYVTETDFRAMTDVYRPRRGDIIFSRNASFGVSSRVETDVEFAIGQDVIVMASKRCDLGFIFHALRSDSIFEQIAKVSSGSTFGRINLAEIRKLKVAVAKPMEQNSIADRLDKAAQCRADLIEEIELFRRLRSGLMEDLLTGKVPVTPLLENRKGEGEVLEEAEA